MAGSDEGLQSVLIKISDPAFEVSTAALCRIPGILPDGSSQPGGAPRFRSRRGFDPGGHTVNETSGFEHHSTSFPRVPAFTPNLVYNCQK